ncbi:MAG TPA: LpqB family beta-propeller domain-containing protein [Streptosporangiaceae bacterium]
MADRWRPAAVVACLALAALAGCATLPTRGQALPVKEAPAGLGQGTDYPQLIPAAPGKGWRPEQIVSGFLAASASFSQDHAFARLYLAPKSAHTWNPGWAVTVVSGPIVPKLVLPANINKPPNNLRVTSVKVSGVQLASISANGQYQQVVSGPARTIRFSLTKVNGQWRITDPPNRLLLSNSEFHRVYQPRNLYYFDSTSKTLVPDPVFVPLQATTTDLATRLVAALGQQPLGWLQGATQTSFPDGTRQLSAVRIEGSAAVVNLGGAIAGASSETLKAVAAQLVWTLTSASYGPSAITSVRLEVNGEPQKIPGSPNGIAARSRYSGMVPVPSADAGLYFVASDGTVQSLPASGSAEPEPVPGQAGAGAVPMTAIAVSPVTSGTPALAGIAANGRDVEIGALSKDARLDRWRPGGKVTSLSWDRGGDLWAATAKGVWLLQPGGKAPTAVDLPFDGKQQVTMLRVAPDGVRVAMIVRGPDGSQVMVGAIAHSGSAASITSPVQVGAKVAQPAAVSWYDADNLAVLVQAGTAAAQIHKVPVNGGQPTELAPAANAISLTVGGGQIVVGNSKGGMATLVVSTDNWRPLPPGQDPAYPG